MEMKMYQLMKERAYVIAEMSANHAGSKETAVKLIHAAKMAGADCVKIQTYTADTMTLDCDNAYFHIGDGTWKGDTLYSLYEKAYMPWEWQAELKEITETLGMDFLSTPFDKTSVDFLESLDVAAYKIASFELTDLPLIQYVASKGKPVILSTGMAELYEIDEAVKTIQREHNFQIILMHCASAYPAITEDMNLYTMQNLKEIYQVPVGLSDHSMGSVGAITAVALGAQIIEKHFCLDRAIETPDSSFSMNPAEFRQMVCDIRQAEKALGLVRYGVKSQENPNLGFRRSIFVTQDIKKGQKLTEENIRVIRPGYGAPPKFYGEALGQTALSDLKRGTPLKISDIGSV